MEKVTRTAIAICVGLLVTPPVVANGQIHGPVSGVWTASGSPYIIVGDIYVPASDTLTMLPGTEVVFQWYYTFNVFGVLLVTGELGDSVVIRGDYYNWWLVDLNFLSAQGQSHLQYGKFSKVLLLMGPSPTFINKCSLGGISAPGSSGNTLINSYMYGGIYGGTDWTVSNNEIDYSVSISNEWFTASAELVVDAEGTFAGNQLHAFASNNLGDAHARGFYGCSGLFAFNTIMATAAFMLPLAFGFDNCSGTCHHNSMEANTPYSMGASYGIDDFTGEIYNNTIINSDYGIKDFSGIVRNCIVYNCNTGFYGPMQVLYSDVYNCTTPFANGATPGIGTIQEDPLLVNTWFLSRNSPCIDAGDPNPFYNDPDGTRDDMGANYFDQGAAYANLTLTPYNPPIQIPAGGGSFDYNIQVQNSGNTQVTGQVWCMATLPNGSLYGPVLGPAPVVLPGGFSGDRDRTQTVPGNAPSGNYTYWGYVGLYPDVIWDEDRFTFEKLTTGDGKWTGEWQNTGESFEDWLSAPTAESIPDAFFLEQNYPNPFNPITVISYSLPEPAKVHLTIYDISGRLVQTLTDGWREAGRHEVTFDGTKLASGIYIYRLRAGNFTAGGKMVLVK